MLATLLAGHIAEKLIFNEMSTGAADDIERATMIARKMTTDYGMSDKLGPRTFGHKEEMVFLGREITEQRNYSEKIAQVIDEEVHNIIERASQVATRLLTENKDRLIKIAKELIAKETLEGDELEAVLSEALPSSPQAGSAKAAPAPRKTRAKTKSVTKKAPILPEPPPETSPHYA
jgi:cell division protease FtsH